MRNQSATFGQGALRTDRIPTDSSERCDRRCGCRYPVGTDAVDDPAAVLQVADESGVAGRVARSMVMLGWLIIVSRCESRALREARGDAPTMRSVLIETTGTADVPTSTD